MMSASKKLLLLTKSFPFNPGNTPAESYLETEMSYLAEGFDKVFIIATEAHEETVCCDLPSNVAASALNLNQGKMNKALFVFKGLFVSIAGNTYEKATFKTEHIISFTQRVFLGYFIKKASTKYKFIKSHLEKYDYVPTHIYSYWLFDTALAQAWLKEDTKALCFARAHGYDLYSERNATNYLPLRDYILRNLDYVFPCSRNGSKYLTDKYPEYCSKIQTMYLGTRDLNIEASQSNDPSLFSIVSCSRVVGLKRVELIAEAVRILDSEGINIKWVHFGDGPCFKKVKKITNTLRNAQVSFPGNITNDSVLKEYQKNYFDIFINVSKYEGLPISIMEACGFGIPILATDVGGTREIVKDGINGRLISKYSDAEAIAEVLNEFLHMTGSDKIAFRKNARSIWNKNFRTSMNVKKMLGVVFAGGE